MEITRRTFLKSATIGGAYCALSGAVPGTLASLYAETPELVAQHINSMCEMCSTRCPITAEIINGKNVYLGGNPLAKSFGGSVCARGGAGHSLLYDPDRLVKPIRRVGERGEGKWEEISWEEAYSYIAEKLLAIKLQHGPESVAFSTKSGSGQSHLFHLAQAYGSPNTFTHATTCPGAYQVAGRAMFAGSLSRDIGNSRYIINFGHSMYGNENPAEAVSLLEASPFKYYIHINDNDAKWDWDYMVGSHNYLSYVEFLYYLKKYNYRDFLTSDTSPTRWDIKETFEANSRMTSKIWTRLDSIDLEAFDRLIGGGDFLKTWKFIESEILGL